MRDRERRPLPGHRPSGREYADTANVGLWFIALLMLGGTVFVVLVAVGVVASSSRAGVLPLTSMFAALTVWLWSLLIWLRLDARRDARRRDTVDPDYRDFRWTSGGFVAPGPRPVPWALTMLAWTVALVGAQVGLFMAMPDNIAVPVVVFALLDVLAVYGWLGVFADVRRARRFGDTSVDYAKFPIRTGEPIELRWRPHRPVPPARHGSFTLRCVAPGEDAFYSEWADKRAFAAPSELPHPDGVALRFEPPRELPGTGADGRYVHWVLEVRLDYPGLDFSEDYPVPVYGEAPAGGSAAS